MNNFKITKTILENINEQNDRINECVDIVNGYTTDEETRVTQELQRQQNELIRQEQYNNNENRFATINSQLDNLDNIAKCEYKQKSTFNGVLKSDRMLTILAGIDSLSNGAGGSNYGQFITPKLYNKYGFGGYGYVGFQNTTIVEDDSWNLSGFKSLENLEQDIAPAKYSFDNKGMYATDCNNGHIYYYFNNKNQKRCKVIYLMQPNGGTFSTGWIGSNTRYTIDTSSPSYDLGVYEFAETNSGGYTGVDLNSCMGKLCIFGVYLYNDEGAIFTRIGKGGDRLSNHSKTDDEFRGKWIDILKPDIYIFNGGANDSMTNTFDGETYTNILNKYLQPFIDKSVHIIAVRPNAISGDTKWDNIFNPILLNYTTAKGIDYLSDKLLLGETYEIANNNGYMLDGVHPNLLGNKKRANNYLSFLGIEQIIFTPTTESGTVIKQYKQELTPKRFIVPKNGGTTEIYNIGMVSGYPAAIFVLDIYGGRNGSAWNSHKRVYLKAASGTVNDRVTEITGFTQNYEYKPSNQTDNYTVNAIIKDNKLSISVTENGDGVQLNLFVTGYGVLTYGNTYANGTWFIEH